MACERARAHTGRAFAFDEVTIIGDTPLDVDCARACGAVAVAVATGFHPAADLTACEPDLFFTDFSDVAAALVALTGRRLTVRVVVLWVHVVAAVVWVGGLAYQAHVLMPAARRGGAALFAEAARRARPVTWTAIALVVLSGFYNVTQLGSLERVMQSGAGLLLAAKFTLVILAVALASQRDFAQVTLLNARRRRPRRPGAGAARHRAPRSHRAGARPRGDLPRAGRLARLSRHPASTPYSPVILMPEFFSL